MQKRSAIPFALVLVAIIAGVCAQAQQAQIQRYDHEIIKRCRTTVAIVDTLDNDITVAQVHRGDTLYVIGTVRKPGWTSSRYLARYGNNVGMLTTSDFIVDAELWPTASATPHSTDNDSTSSTIGSSTGSGHMLQTGPRGGQYYINANGNKTYVKRKK